MITPVFHRFDSVGSTNDVALEMAREGAPGGTVVTTKSQTKGRGRRGRQWVDSPGQSIIMSAILRPDTPANRLSELAFTAAVAVAEMVEQECDLQPQVKWPNDVLIHDRKLCGILVETTGDAAIVGIGVNVRQTEFPSTLSSTPPCGGGESAEPGGPPGPTSIALEEGTCTDVRRLTEALASSLFSTYELDFKEILARWRKYMWGVGRLVEVVSVTGSVSGTIADIDYDGALLISEEGNLRRVIAADVIRILK
jgi:BirA family biotin operon repressor/biotin-[acetyl-CoA-carboxylase] ligase